jgi:tellurite resistance-related uncharacterized protein
MEEPLDTKVAVVLLEELPVWQKANVAAFLVSGIAGSARGSWARLTLTVPGTVTCRS